MLGTGSYSDTPYSDKCFWKGATNTNSNPNLNPNSNPNPLQYPFRNVGIAAVGIAAASRLCSAAFHCTYFTDSISQLCLAALASSLFLNAIDMNYN